MNMFICVVNTNTCKLVNARLQCTYNCIYLNHTVCIYLILGPCLSVCVCAFSYETDTPTVLMRVEHGRYLKDELGAQRIRRKNSYTQRIDKNINICMYIDTHTHIHT